MLRLWDGQTGKSLHVFMGHTYKVYDIAFSPDGKLLASASEDTTARLWDVETGESLHRWRERNSNDLFSVAFSPDGKTLASGTYNMTYLWDVQTRTYLQMLGDRVGSRHLVFSPDGKTLISGSRHNTVHLLDVKTGIEHRKMVTHTGSIGSIAFSPDGKILASGGLWNIQTGESLQTEPVAWGYLPSVAISPDLKTIAGGGTERTVFLWDIQTGAALPLQLEGNERHVASVLTYC